MGFWRISSLRHGDFPLSYQFATKTVHYSRVVLRFLKCRGRNLRRCVVISLSVWGIWAGVGIACESPWWDPNAAEKPIRLGAECSFDRGGPNEESDVTGTTVKSIGGARIAQVITDHHVCTFTQRLLVVDCASAELILVLSVPRPRNASNLLTEPPRPIENILRPKGAIRLNERLTLDRLRKIAKRKSYPFTEDPDDAHFAGMDSLKGFDPFCGCKLLHPDSLGATK